MNIVSRHIRSCLYIAVVLLYWVAGRASSTVAGDTASMYATEVSSHDMYDDACAVFSEKEDDLLHALREMGQWGIPSSSITLQGAVGRVPAFSEVSQRIGRTLGVMPFYELSCANVFVDTLRHTLSSIRFYTGYYIYYRCQMRC